MMREAQNTKYHGEEETDQGAEEAEKRDSENLFVFIKHSSY